MDVFDFFNVPRLPVGPGTGVGDAGGHGVEAGGGGGGGNGNGTGLPGEFNITDFMVDANRDWLFQQGDTKFLG